MNVNDVSGEQWLVRMMEMWQQNADRAQQRKGELVRDHPPRDRLVSHHMMVMMMTKMQETSVDGSAKANVQTSQLPLPYPPCERPIRELLPIPVKEMRLETHHRGRMALVRVLTPPHRMTGVLAIVEDEQGTALLLQVYHQPVAVPPEEVMTTDDIFIVKEPFLKITTDGSYSLRVDHLGDIVKLTSTDEMVPRKWKHLRPTNMSSSKSVRTQGNDAVQSKEWAKAHRLYTSAIEIAQDIEDKRLAHLNRSLTYMRLGRPFHALEDARQGSDPSSPSEKGLYREARALYELGDFAQALERFEMLAVSYPETAVAKPEIARVKARLREQQTGVYSFGEMYKQARKTPPLIDCATFSAPVEVRASPGRGNGLFTKTPVSAGQLLVCEKAFGYCYAGQDQTENTSFLLNMATKKGYLGGQATLLSTLVQKLYYGSLEMRTSFGELYHGDYTVHGVSEADGVPVVDSFLVGNVMSLNCFGAPRTSREVFLDGMMPLTAAEENAKLSFATCGIWLLASRINHSCVGNCRRSFIGDMQIIRATKDLEADTELCFEYRKPELMISHREAQKKFHAWGFTCSCELCQLRTATTDAVRARRQEIRAELRKVIRGLEETDVMAVKRLIWQLEQTYSSDTLQLELWDPCTCLGYVLLKRGKPVGCVEMVLKGLRALGFVIEANPRGKGRKPSFEVTRWGYAEDTTPWAFLLLFEAYKQLAPELCGIAKRYAAIARSIKVGEDETLDDELP